MEEVNRKAVIDVVMLKAVEKHQEAMRLRDEGKVEEARRTLQGNREYLDTNAQRFDSQKLREYGNQQTIDANNMDEEHWKRQRKEIQQLDSWKMY